jgi:ubiquinone/menaquinone biosynthesis C-methylase UbiE
MPTEENLRRSEVKDKTKTQEDKTGLSSELSRFYSIFGWPDDPETEAGKRYLEATAESVDRLLKHSLVQRMIAQRRKVRILEICGGTGFGGVALAKALMDKKIRFDLLITDLRKDALKAGQRWGRQILGQDVQIDTADAREVHRLRKKFDLCLMYGLSTPHFNPWDMVRILASVSQALADDGLFAIDEMDRKYQILMVQGYKWAYAEGHDEGKLTLSFHTGYDPVKGSCKRTFLGIKDLANPVTTDILWWGLAEVGAMAWTFFKDVHLLNVRGMRHFLLGSQPRRALKPGDLKAPSMVQ